MPLLNSHVLAGLAELFGCDEDVAEHCVKEAVGVSKHDGENASESEFAHWKASIQLHVNGGQQQIEIVTRPASGATPRSDDALAEPFPEHSFVLHRASAWFHAKFAYLKVGELNVDRGQQQEQNADSTYLPLLRVPLGDATEGPAARAAIRFAYTGRIEAHSIQEAFGVYRQAQYLQIEGCAAHCADVIKSLMTRALSVGLPLQDIIDLAQIWTDPVVDPAFANYLSSMAKPLLVAHFGDSAMTLNTAGLRRQLLALPVEALEVLLELNDFGTDAEDTVLHMLATWLEENTGSISKEVQEQLCRLVRLAQLTPEFATAVLPGLAAARLAAQTLDDSSDGEVAAKRSGWFPISCAEASYFIARLHASVPYVGRRAYLLETGGVLGDLLDERSHWYCGKPRRRCLLGRTSSGAKPAA
ncbi:hypothetical protein GPECTOR_607g687 [Gonium pectorale]|uniref:BACK domain-containing protein n=1 Tax=Gonium pectorale TaxID=33097 RepID=A0A150FUH5_GONPE|nr:hypothetical protein GPECTOR_607g687 [Gonium pectorale]|eukprot:KXZ41249.1 hypothetical protein GPECTOR_607g687 [Gonium pectorale]